MSDYTKSTNFGAKDNLPTGDPGKVIKGSEFDTEFDNLQTAVATKANKVSGATSGNLATLSSTGDLQDSSKSIADVTNWGTGGNILVPHENLVVTRTTASTVRVQADALLLKDSSGNPKRVTSVDVTVDLTASGAGGLDTGAEAASTWYYVHVIAKSDGTVSAVFSTSPTSPTMPTGYTYKGLVAADYNSSSGDLYIFEQKGERAALLSPPTILNTYPGGVGNTAYNSLSLATVCPPNAATCQMWWQVAERTTGTNTYVRLSYDGTYEVAQLGGGTPTTSYAQVNVLELLNRSQTIYYKVDDANDDVYAKVLGWRF